MERVVFRQGTHECSGDGWSARVHVPHDVTLARVEQAFSAMLKGARNG